MQDLGIRREKERQRRRGRTGGSGKSKKIFTTKSFLFPPVVGICFPMSRDFSSTSLPFPVTFRRVIRPFISHADARGNLCDIDTTRGATRARDSGLAFRALHRRVCVWSRCPTPRACTCVRRVAHEACASVQVRARYNTHRQRWPCGRLSCPRPTLLCVAIRLKSRSRPTTLVTRNYLMRGLGSAAHERAAARGLASLASENSRFAASPAAYVREILLPAMTHARALSPFAIMDSSRTRVDEKS